MIPCGYLPLGLNSSNDHTTDFLSKSTSIYDYVRHLVERPGQKNENNKIKKAMKLNFDVFICLFF